MVAGHCGPNAYRALQTAGVQVYTGLAKAPSGTPSGSTRPDCCARPQGSIFNPIGETVSDGRGDRATEGGTTMPRGDRTGPMGGGPLTGRGAGYCGGAGTPKFLIAALKAHAAHLEQTLHSLRQRIQNLEGTAKPE